MAMSNDAVDRAPTMNELWNHFKTGGDAISVLELALDSNRLGVDEGEDEVVDDRDDEYLLLKFFKELLQSIPPDVLVSQHQLIVLKLINSAPSRLVKWMVDDYLQMFTKEETAKESLHHNALAILVALTRRIPRIEGGRSLANFIRHFIDVGEVQAELQNQLNNSTTHDAEARFRVYQVAQAAMEMERPQFNALHPLVDRLIGEIDDWSDLLGCITGLELLSEMASAKRENAEYFHRIGLLTRTYEMLERTREDPDAGLIHTACHRFFGYLASIAPDSLQTFPKFTAEVFNMVYHFDALDAPRRLLAFDSLAVISTSSGAKAYLSSADSPHNMTKAMNHFGVAIATGTEEMRVRHLKSLEVMMSHCESDADSSILLDWWKELGAPFSTLITNYLRQPLESVRLQCFGLLVALFSTHSWAPHEFIRTSGFIEHLTERKVQLTAMEAQLKYDVVCALVSNSHDAPSPTMEHLKRYKAQGVFYSPATVAIATENP